eukprot:1156859-Pelagomonas_calceolata.AAC.6
MEHQVRVQRDKRGGKRVGLCRQASAFGAPCGAYGASPPYGAPGMGSMGEKGRKTHKRMQAGAGIMGKEVKKRKATEPFPLFARHRCIGSASLDYSVNPRACKRGRSALFFPKPLLSTKEGE